MVCTSQAACGEFKLKAEETYGLVAVVPSLFMPKGIQYKSGSETMLDNAVRQPEFMECSVTAYLFV